MSWPTSGAAAACREPVITRRACIAPIAAIVLGLLLFACSTVKNTPAQDEAWTRWATCRSQVPGVEIRNVQLDGRITFWANGAFQGRSMLDCLARAGANGPALPEAAFATWPSGA